MKAVAGWLSLSLAACASGPPLHSYLLETAPAAPLAAVPSAREEPIVVRRVRVPDYLDTTDMLLRDGGDEVKTSTTGRWAERLSEGLTRAVAADLALRLPPDAILLDPWGQPQRQLMIDVTALNLWPDGRCVIAATWRIVEHDAPRAVVTGSGTFDATPTASLIGGSDERLVEAVSRAVGKLADSIAPMARVLH